MSRGTDYDNRIYRSNAITDLTNRELRIIKSFDVSYYCGVAQPIDQLIGVLFAWIARVIAAGGGGAVVAYLIFRRLGRTWLDQHFSKQLEQFRHERQKELEQFRHRINTLFSRISKIHEKEFEVLPKAWELLHKAHGATFDVIKSLKEYPDFDRMSEAQFEEFLKGSRLAEFEKGELRTTSRRPDYYRKAIYWRDWSDADLARIELGNYLVLNSIFMTESLRQQFQQINEALAKLLINEKYGAGQPFNQEHYRSISETMGRVSQMFNQIESAVQQRLRYEEA